MKVTVLRPPPIDASDTTPPPGRAVRVVGDAQGFSIDGETPQPWSAARFVSFHRPAQGQAVQALLVIEGRRRPVDVSSAAFEGPTFDSAAGDLRQAIVRLMQQAPHVVIDHGAFKALRGDDPGLLTADVRAYVAAVQRSLSGHSATRPVVQAEPLPAEPSLAEPETVAEEPAERCPHCDHPRPAEAKTCDRCGIIFAKVDPPISTASQPLPSARPNDLGLDLESAEDELPVVPATDSVLRAETLATTVIGMVRTYGSLLMWTAAVVIAAWVLVGIGIFALMPAGPWRIGALGLISVTAYVHAMASLTTAIHAAAVEERSIPLGAAFARGLGRVPTLLTARLLALIPITLGLVALIVPGFVFALRSVFLETVATIEREPPSGIGWNQVSANVTDGFRLSTAALLALTSSVLIATAVVPICAVTIGTILELVDPSGWLTLSPGALAAALGVLAWTCAALAIWAIVLYALTRELASQQGPGLWNSPSGLSGLFKVVLLVDLFLLLVALVRASRLTS